MAPLLFDISSALYWLFLYLPTVSRVFLTLCPDPSRRGPNKQSLGLKKKRKKRTSVPKIRRAAVVKRALRLALWTRPSILNGKRDNKKTGVVNSLFLFLFRFPFLFSFLLLIFLVSLLCPPSSSPLSHSSLFPSFPLFFSVYQSIYTGILNSMTFF